MNPEDRPQFVQPTSETILSEQEQIRGAPVTELRPMTDPLRKAYAEVERQVQERTAELRAANESLRHEIAERIRAEQALRESEARFRAIFEGAGIGMRVVDIEGRPIMSNPALQDMLGYSTEELHRMVFTEFTHPDDVAADMNLFRELVEGKRDRYQIEKRYYRKDGQLVWGRLTVSLIRGADGEPRLAIGMMEDITERVRAQQELQRAHDELETRVEERTARLAEANRALRAEICERQRMEEALRESEERFRTVFESAPIGIVMENAEGRFLHTNRAFQKMLGYSEDELRDMFAAGVTHPDDAKEELRLFSEILEGQRNEYHIQKRYCRKDGRVVWGDLAASVVRDANGKYLYGFAMVNDITERMRAEEAVWRRTEQLEALRQVGLELAAELELDSLLRSIVSRAMELLEGRTGGLYLYRPERDILEWAVAVGPTQALMGSVLHRGEGLSGKVWETGKPLIVDNYQQWEGRAAIYEGLSIGAVVAVPVRWGPAGAGGGFLGVLDVTRPGGGCAFSLADAELLSLFAAQAAVAIQNARLYEAEQRARRTAETLRAANISLTQSLDLDAVLDTLLDFLSKLIPYDSASVQLLEADSYLAVRTVRGYERWADPDRIRTLSFDARANPIAQALVATQKSMLIPDTREYPGWERPAGMEYVRNWIGVPLVAGGKVIGLYALDKAEPGFFTEEHLQLAEVLAGQAAVAIQNARLYEQVRDGRARLQQLAQQVVAAQEEERRRMSHALHDEAGQALTALRIGLELLQSELPIEAELARQRLHEAAHSADSTLERIRLLAHDLRPPGLDAVGLNPTVESLCLNFARRSGLVIDYLGQDLAGLPDAVSICLYRCVQEALTNVAKHAQANHVQVALSYDGETISVSIEDDGQGFDPQVVTAVSGPPLGIGLLGMQERLRLVGGHLEAKSRPGQGTRLVARVPLNEYHRE